MDENLSKLKDQILKIEGLKKNGKMGIEYQSWLNKTEKLVREIFAGFAHSAFSGVSR